MCGFIAQLVEQCTGNAEVTGSNFVEARIFFRLLLSNCLIGKFTVMIILHFQRLLCLIIFLAGKKGTTEHAAVWVPDSEASTCMHCLKSKFTAINRRVCMSVNLNDQCCFIDPLGTLRNYNGDGNGNIKKAKGLIS